MHKKSITIPTRSNSLIPAHQNFILALAKGLIAPLNTSIKTGRVLFLIQRLEARKKKE
jgi:hypothetical protein